jgi:Leucine-rich repeat (LRR) protein
LYCGENELTDLDVNECSKLRRLHCSDNQLIKLDISQCDELEYLHCAKNRLIDLKLPSKKSSLKQLIVHENRLEESLSPLEGFTNLEELHLGGNLFHGSLEPLRNLSKLRCLDISDSNINIGLTYLPSDIKEFHCYAFVNPQAKVMEIQKELKTFAVDEKKGKYD